MVVYGLLSGQPTGLAAQSLVQRCLTVTGFNTPGQRPADMMRAGKALIEMLERGELEVVAGGEYPLAEAAAAHRALESGGTSGKVILKVH